jgi:hypothetical protein
MFKFRGRKFAISSNGANIASSHNKTLLIWQIERFDDDVYRYAYSDWAIVLTSFSEDIEEPSITPSATSMATDYYEPHQILSEPPVGRGLYEKGSGWILHQEKWGVLWVPPELRELDVSKDTHGQTFKLLNPHNGLSMVDIDISGVKFTDMP